VLLLLQRWVKNRAWDFKQAVQKLTRLIGLNQRIAAHRGVCVRTGGGHLEFTAPEASCVFTILVYEVLEVIMKTVCLTEKGVSGKVP